MPACSIALPVRDAAPWLAECLESVFAQDEGDFELLAVDDGSRDGSRGLLEDAARRDRRVRVLETSREGRGIAAALNLALAEARSAVLVRMDADDRMHPRRLALQLGALRDAPALFAVASRARAFPEEALRDGMRAYLDWQNSLLAPSELARDRFVESPVLHPSVALRTEVARRELGGWRHGPWPEDWDFFLRAFERGLAIARLPEVLVEWRVHERQSTRTDARYAAEALVELRARSLARHLAAAASGRPVWILGAGPVGKALAKALAREGLVAAGLADVDPRKIGGVVRGSGCAWRVAAHSSLYARAPRPFGVSAVAGAEARARVRRELGSHGWIEGEDFVVAA